MLHAAAKAFEEGGWGMYPIAVVAMMSIAIIVERMIVLFTKVPADKKAILGTLRGHLFKGDLARAIRFLADQKPTPMVNILKAGLLNVPKGEVEVQAAMDEASLRETPIIEKRVGYLAMLSNAATLWGLLGTVTGLIKCFAAVGQVNPADKATILSLGISEAMNCTAFGLGAAIPTLMVYSFLQGRAQHLMEDIHETAVGVLNMVMQNRDKLNTQLDGDLAAKE
jgi:biopolymer transport protein ExbB